MSPQRMLMDPLKAQGFRTQRPESPEDLWQPLYDRVEYPGVGTTSMSFFSIPRGGTASLIVNGAVVPAKVKTLRDTNIDNANVVPTKMFKIVGVSIGFAHEDENEISDPGDRDIWRTGSYIKFRIVDKDLLILPIVSIPEVNPYVAVAAGAGAAILATAGGGGQNVPMYRFGVPITLNPYENFNVEINTDGPVTTISTKAMDVYCILHAFMRRPT